MMCGDSKRALHVDIGSSEKPYRNVLAKTDEPKLFGNESVGDVMAEVRGLLQMLLWPALEEIGWGEPF